VRVLAGTTRFIRVSVLMVLIVIVPAGVTSAAQLGRASSSQPLATGVPKATFEDPAATPSDGFGGAVAISAPTKTAIIGAPTASDDVGSAYIFSEGPSGWSISPSATLTNPAGSDQSLYGNAVAISGDTAVVGADYTDSQAGVAYIYQEGLSGWPSTPTATLTDPLATPEDLFGAAVAISGNAVIVGSTFANGDGAAYLYVKDASGWPTTPTATLPDPPAEASTYFGSSVSLSDKTALVGAYGTDNQEGVAYLYEKGASGWTSIPTTTLMDPRSEALDQFGLSTSLLGGTAVVGAADNNGRGGEVYVYKKSSDGWPSTPVASMEDPHKNSANHFGEDVSVSEGTIVVGSSLAKPKDEGATYIYNLGPSGWPTDPTVTLTDPATGHYDQFGAAVSASGKIALIGANGTNSAAGAAYIFAT
jgi:FG-GAP repeat